MRVSCNHLPAAGIGRAPGPGGPGPPGPGGPGLEHRPPAPGGRQSASAHGPHRQSHARPPSPPLHRRARHAQLPGRRPRRPAIRNQFHRPQAHLISDPHPARHIDHSSEPVMVQPPPDTTLHFRVQNAHLGARGVRRCLRPPRGAPPRGTRRRRLSKSVAKARIEPGPARRIVDIPRFFSPPTPVRGAFATDLDTPPPRTVPGTPSASARPLAHRFARVCYALSFCCAP